MTSKRSKDVLKLGPVALASVVLGGCVTAPATIDGMTYSELEQIGAIEASKSCKFLRDQHESGKTMTELAIAADKAACLSTVRGLKKSPTGNETDPINPEVATDLDALAKAQPDSLSEFDNAGIDCDFERNVNGPEIFWGIHLGDSQDATVCSLLNAGIQASDETRLGINQGGGRLKGFLDEIFGLNGAGYPFPELQAQQNVTFHAINQVSFRRYLEINQFGISRLRDDVYASFQEAGGPSKVDHWSEWAEYLYEHYESQNVKDEHRQFRYLPDIDPDYPEVFWARNQCSDLSVSNLPIGNTVWDVGLTFFYVDNGFPILVDRIEAGEELHELGRIDGKPIYTSCILRTVTVRASDNTPVEKQKLVGVYDALRTKVGELFPQALASEDAKVGDNGSFFYVEDGWSVTMAVDEYQDQPYPAAIVFEYLPAGLRDQIQRGAEKLSEQDEDAEIIL